MILDKQLIQAIRVAPGSKIRLDRFSTRWPNGESEGNLDDFRNHAKDLLEENLKRLSESQQRLYADDRFAVLIIFQAMDAAGKDGTIRHVMSGINPQGCQVFSFKHPSAEELDHTFLWRSMCALPERGRIGIFNRSYYEDVLITRVHPKLLEHQQLPPGKRGKSFWAARYEDIRHFERHLASNGTILLKFFLHVSKDEQKRRLLARLTDPGKHWKFSAADLQERGYWNDYMRAYEDAISHTSTPFAPWHIVPADHKWLCRALVSETICRRLKTLKLEYPRLSVDQQKELDIAKKRLENE
jgi:PPK2 family polyphosphate:nucleotide phosphotransferase